MTQLECLGRFKDFSDGTIKTVLNVGQNEIIEVSLLLNKNDMDVVCVPTHHFCSLGCQMCHLTNQGLNKQMKTIKVDHLIEAIIYGVTTRGGDRRTTNNYLLISFMGVGEPFLNLSLVQGIVENESVLKRVLGYQEIGYALSTMMPNQHINSFTN
jgi:adenine C2-methylase RlmN of 23S rRNA A2503 and tRNA A37